MFGNKKTRELLENLADKVGYEVWNNGIWFKEGGKYPVEQRDFTALLNYLKLEIKDCEATRKIVKKKK